MNVEEEAEVMATTVEEQESQAMEARPERAGRRWAAGAIVAAGACLVLLVAGALVATTSDDDSGGSGEIDASMSAPGTVADGVSNGMSVVSPAGSEVAKGGDLLMGRSAPVVPPVGGSQTVDPAGPRIVHTAELAVRVEEGRFTGAFDRVATIAAANGGFVVSSSTSTTEEQGSGRATDTRPVAGSVTLRVAADRFDAARLALTELGTVERQSLQGQDVGGQIVDYDARLRSLRAQEESLNALLGKASAVGEVIQVQNALFGVRQQVEQLQGQRDQLAQAAALATINVSLFEPGAGFVPRPEPATGLADSFERAVDGAMAVVGGMIVVVGWLTPIAVLALLGWGAFRLRRRGQKLSVPVSAPAAP